MKTRIKYIAPLLAAAAISGAVGLAPVALAATGTTSVANPSAALNRAPAPADVDPLVPYGPDPYTPFILGDPYQDQTGNSLDLPS